MEKTIKETLLMLELAIIDAARSIAEGNKVYKLSDDPVTDVVRIRQTVIDGFIKAVASAWGIQFEEAYAYMLHEAIHEDIENE